MIAVGASLVITTFVANLYKVGPAFDRETDGFRPLMTKQSIQTYQQDLASLNTATTEIQTKMLPALASQLKMTPDQLNGMMAQNFPAVATGLQAMPGATARFTGLINTMDANRHLFASADAIPTKNLPATTVPWGLLAIGVIAIALGGVLWFVPRSDAVIATVVGAAIIVVTLAFSLVTKANDADKLNAAQKPIYTQQTINDGKATLATLSAMGTEMQTKMLPALAQQLHMTPAQMQQFFVQSFPATATTLADLPATQARFQKLVATFDKHLGDWNTLKPVSFAPVIWLLVSGGIALFVIGGVGVWVTSGRSEATKES